MQATLQQTFDAYHVWLGIPPEEQPPNHYRLLGIGLFESQPDVIASAADRQMGHLRTFQSGKHSELSQQLLNEVAAAKICLLNPARKAAYDGQLRQEANTAEDAEGDLTPWADIADQLPAIREWTGAKGASSTSARRVAGKRRTNFGPTIAVCVTCVLLPAGLLAWNATQQVDHPIDRTANAKVGKQQTNEQPTRRQSLDRPKARVRTAIGDSDDPPPQIKSSLPVAPTPPRESPVVEAPPAAEAQPAAPGAMPTFENPVNLGRRRQCFSSRFRPISPRGQAARDACRL